MRITLTPACTHAQHHLCNIFVIRSLTLPYSCLPPRVQHTHAHHRHCRVSFLAGQWVDVFIPGLDTVGGFSIVNAPSLRPGSDLPAPVEVHRAAAGRDGVTGMHSSSTDALDDNTDSNDNNDDHGHDHDHNDAPHRTLVQLAVKMARYPPAKWMHTACTVGSEVAFRVGGSVVLRESDHARPALFIAGGIGIAPLHSMIAERSLNTGG
jgi:hypothetical protein